MNHLLRRIAIPAAVGLVLCSSSPQASPSQPGEPLAPVTLHFIARLQTNAQAKKPSEAIVPLPDGKGKEVAQRLCGTCHGTNVWVKQRHTPEKWSSIVDNMISKGLEASDDDLNTLTDYLSTYLAPPPDAPPNPSTPPPGR